MEMGSPTKQAWGGALDYDSMPLRVHTLPYFQEHGGFSHLRWVKAKHGAGTGPESKDARSLQPCATEHADVEPLNPNMEWHTLFNLLADQQMAAWSNASGLPYLLPNAFFSPPPHTPPRPDAGGCCCWAACCVWGAGGCRGCSGSTCPSGGRGASEGGWGAADPCDAGVAVVSIVRSKPPLAKEASKLEAGLLPGGCEALANPGGAGARGSPKPRPAPPTCKRRGSVRCQAGLFVDAVTRPVLLLLGSLKKRPS